MPEAAPDSADWPGERLGLPESGPRSIGRFGRRVAAIAIDWAIAYLIVFACLRPDPFGFKVLGLFAVIQVIFLLLVNGSIGHIILGMRVVPVRPGYLGLWRPIVRTILLCLVIPAVIFDKDQRGLHDRWVGTILVRR
ncbi:MAG TPA: RDD family protein [Galbitalea sp.]|jgi:hypothetical protein